MRTELLCSALAIGLLAQACASAPPPAPATPAAPPNAAKAEFMEADAPKWVRNGCGAFFGEKKNLICGVGIVAGMTNPGIARSAAEGRGRTEIARSLRVRIAAMQKDYQAATQGGPANATSSEQYIEDTSKQITNQSLSGSRLQDTWVSSRGSVYALMVIDLDAFKSQVKAMNDLDERLRAAIVDRAEKSFAELDSATEGPLPPLPQESASATP